MKKKKKDCPRIYYSPQCEKLVWGMCNWKDLLAQQDIFMRKKGVLRPVESIIPGINRDVPKYNLGMI